MKWFKHDSDANRDAKLRKVKMKYGMEGYGLYWHCLEEIVNNIETNNLSFELEHDSQIISHDTGISSELVSEMMVFMSELGLFEIDNGVITCLKLAKRLDQSMTSNPVLRKKIKHIHDLIPDRTFAHNHDPVMMESCPSHDEVMQEEMRREENRIKRVVKKRFVPPSKEDVTLYLSDKSYAIDVDRFLDFYEAKGWMVGKNKMKCWKAAVRNAKSWCQIDNTSHQAVGGV